MDYSDFYHGPDVTLQEQIFHNSVREVIITAVLGILLYVVSYVTLCQFRRVATNEDMYAGEEDDVVYRISLWLCTGTLSVSVGAVLLLPMSIISNEVVRLYPSSYYIKWLNSSLILGLWNHVFFFSNLAMFILMPFAYFFMEAEGFSGSKKGLMARVREAFVVLLLLGLLVLGIAFVAKAIISGDERSKQTLLDVWHEHVPYMYSYLSFSGVLALLVCSPFGVARMFTVLGRLIVKPKSLQKRMEEELNALRFEEENLLRKLKYRNFPASLSNGHAANTRQMMDSLDEVVRDRKALESRQHVSFWKRNVFYGFLILLIFLITVFSILIVVLNIFQVLLGWQSLPTSVVDAGLGSYSLSVLGPFGAALQIVVILYLMTASVLGFYSLPYLCKLHPRLGDTSMVKICLNCVIILLLSSALPILSKTLGITNFDLLGKYGTMKWLDNVYIIFLSNLTFVVSTPLLLVKKATTPVGRELIARLQSALSSIRSSSRSNSTSTETVVVVNGNGASFTSSGRPDGLKTE